MTALTPSELSEQINSLDARLVEIGEETARLALSAAEGDAAAATRLGAILEDRRLTLADREILVHARTAARWRHEEAAEAEVIAARSVHIQAAIRHLNSLVGLAARADELIEEFHRVTGEITKIETQLRRDALSAGFDVNAPRVGLRGAAVHAAELMRDAKAGGKVSDFVATGWAGLTKDVEHV